MSVLITVLTRKGYPTSFVLLGIGIVFTIAYSLQTFVFAKEKPEITISVIGLILLIGVLSTVGNLMLFQAANNAPNPGLAIAIGAGMQAGVVALLAFLFLKDKLSPLQILGLVLALISIFLIVAGQNKSNDNTTSTKNPGDLSMVHGKKF